MGDAEPEELDIKREMLADWRDRHGSASERYGFYLCKPCTASTASTSLPGTD